MFSVKYQDIITQVREINPVDYARTRNLRGGAVSRLSPYITRGVLSLPQIREHVLANFTLKESEKFIQELAWREYFQKVWLARGDGIVEDLRFPQDPVRARGVPQAIVSASTGIDAIDEAIKELYATGYMHNHARMTVASVVCNLGGYGWWEASRWMYYHLLDGDVASNSLSWQWVAGTSTAKKYTTSQSLVNYWSGSQQQGTFLDFERETMLGQAVPEELGQSMSFEAQTELPASDEEIPATADRVLVYHPWHLDSTWREDEKGLRVLVLEPSCFARFPVSPQVISFILNLARENLPDVYVFVGEIAELPVEYGQMVTKEHPLVAHFPARFDEREWLFPEVKDYYPSFFKFWKDCQG